MRMERVDEKGEIRNPVHDNRPKKPSRGCITRARKKAIHRPFLKLIPTVREKKCEQSMKK